MSEEARKITMMDDEIEMYTDILKEGTPFDRFVSRGDVRDIIDIKAPRVEAERAVRRAIRSTLTDGTPRLIPIIGIAGTGKTHFYWVLKDLEEIEKENWVCVYVPSPPTPVRTLLHIYTCLADEINNLFDVVSDQIVDIYGKKGKLFGPSMKEVIGKAIRSYPGVAVDVIRALIIYGMAKEQTLKHAAERWLLGENFTEEELEKLKLNSVLESDDVCLATLRIFAQNLKKVIILYFDELEIPYRTFGSDAEMQLLETIKRIYNEVPNVIIITACLEEVWNRILNEIADPAFKSRMERETHLQPFRVEDIEEFYIFAMKYFWEYEKNVPLPVNPLFPFNPSVFREVFTKSKGNPRESIKILREYMDAVLFGEGLPKPGVPEITPTISAGISANMEGEISLKSSVQMKIGEEEYTFEVNPATVAGAAIDSISTLAHELNKELDINLEYGFKGKTGKSKSIAGFILDKDSQQRYGLEVPSIKTFDRSGGVAAFYAASRLIEAVEVNEIDKGILIVPKGTSGKKYTSILESAGNNVITIELIQSEAESLLRDAKKNPSIKGREIAHVLFPNISLEVPQVAVEASTSTPEPTESIESTESAESSTTETTESASEKKKLCPFCKIELNEDQINLIEEGFNAICSKCHKIIRAGQL